MSKIYVPIEPFRNWLIAKSKRYQSKTELAKIIQMNEGKVNAIIENRPYADGGRKNEDGIIPPRLIDKLAVRVVDRALTQEGTTHLVELYPEYYESDN